MRLVFDALGRRNIYKHSGEEGMSDRATLACISKQRHEEMCVRHGALLKETYIASHIIHLCIYYTPIILFVLYIVA